MENNNFSSHARSRSISATFKRGLRRPLSIISSASSSNLRDFLNDNGSSENQSFLIDHRQTSEPTVLSRPKRRTTSTDTTKRHSMMAISNPSLLESSSNRFPMDFSHSRRKLSGGLTPISDTPRSTPDLDHLKELPPLPPVIPKRSTSRNFTSTRVASPQLSLQNGNTGAEGDGLMTPSKEEKISYLPQIDHCIGQWISATDSDYILYPKTSYSHQSQPSTDSSFSRSSVSTAADSPQVSTFSDLGLKKPAPTTALKLPSGGSGVYLADDESFSPCSLSFSCTTSRSSAFPTPPQSASSSMFPSTFPDATASLLDEDFNPFLEDEPPIKHYRTQINLNLRS